jgi:lipase chaperone LimK
MAILCFVTQAPVEPTPESREAATTTTVFGPGAWVQPSSGATLVTNTSSGPASAPSVDADGNLLVDTVLRDAIEFFLLEQTGDDGMTALRSYMASRLPPAASKEAVRIAEQYGVYMQRHDRQIASQNFSNDAPPDTSRIATWLQQRTRLRHEVLGEAVTQAWYQNEDAQLQQALGEFKQRGAEDLPYAALAPTEDGVAAVPHWRNPADALQHEQYIIGLLRDATDSFAARALERRQFADRYNAYADNVEQIAANLGPDSTERATRIGALREKYFLTETEKQQAQARWTATHQPH